MYLLEYLVGTNVAWVASVPAMAIFYAYSVYGLPHKTMLPVL